MISSDFYNNKLINILNLFLIIKKINKLKQIILLAQLIYALRVITCHCVF
jgi:hypothetical protein